MKYFLSDVLRSLTSGCFGVEIDILKIIMVFMTLLEVCEDVEGETSLSPNLPAASSQVLQSPGCSLQGVWVGALRQQREVRLHNGGVPQHLDAFRGLRQVRKGANAIPLWNKRQNVGETNRVKLFVWSGLITTLVPCLGGSDQEGSLMEGREEEWKNLEEECERPAQQPPLELVSLSLCYSLIVASNKPASLGHFWYRQNRNLSNLEQRR